MADAYQTGYLDGLEAERERIIKLLEGELTAVESKIDKIKGGFWGDYSFVLKVDVDNLKGYIALIKGEK